MNTQEKQRWDALKGAIEGIEAMDLVGYPCARNRLPAVSPYAIIQKVRFALSALRSDGQDSREVQLLEKVFQERSHFFFASYAHAAVANFESFVRSGACFGNAAQAIEYVDGLLCKVESDPHGPDVSHLRQRFEGARGTYE